MDTRQNMVNEEIQESASVKGAAGDGSRLVGKGLKESEHIADLAGLQDKDMEAGELMQDTLKEVSDITTWGAKTWAKERDIEF